MADRTPEHATHDWYHDGSMSNTKSGYNRLCRRCRFREQVIGHLTCFGSSEVYEAAHAEGHSAGIRAEKDRLRRLMGL